MVQFKIRQHIKNKENLNLQWKKQSTDAKTEKPEMLRLSDKCFKATIIKCCNKQS